MNKFNWCKNMFLQAVVIISLLLLCACSKPIDQQEGWTKWRGPSGDGTIRDEAFNPSFINNKDNIKWRTTVGSGYSGLCVSNNRVYTMGKKNDSGAFIDVVYCIDSKNGKIVWTYEYTLMREYPYAGPRAMPVVDGDRLFTLSADGDLTALDVHSGEKIWDRNIPYSENLPISIYGITGSPVIEKGVIYLNIGGGIALNADTGKTIWKGKFAPTGYATPVLLDYKGTRAVMFFTGNMLRLLNAADGKIIASSDWINEQGINAADPLIVEDGNVLVSTSYRSDGSGMYDFSSGSFEEKWVRSGISTHFSSLIKHDELVYGIHGDTNARGRCEFTCLDPLSGEVVWSSRTSLYGSLIKVNNTIIYLNENGQLYTVEPSREGFKVSSSLNALYGRANSWVAPSYWKGHLYLRSNSGEVVCVKAI
ncbi:MAG: PQQ-binding-like beta-propeller repeat protein [Spirochaetes bacterium]|nr:PQQ-binding-like beta-propeller repeat protein [Spirochaetota bacterium]